MQSHPLQNKVAFPRSLSLRRPRRVGLALLALAAAVGTVIAAVSWSGEQSLGAPPIQAEVLSAPAPLSVGGRGEGWVVRRTDALLDATETVRLLDWRSRRVILADRGSGSVLATIDVGAYPMATAVPGTSYLAVADVVPDGSGILTSRVLLFDMAQGLSLVSELPLDSSRTRYTVYASTFAAHDGAVFYATVRQDQSPECQSSGDAAACDILSIAAVTLTGIPLLAVDLPRGCGLPGLTSSAGILVATCPEAGAYRIGREDGVVTANLLADISPPRESAKDIVGSPSRRMMTWFDGSSIGALFVDGSYVLIRDGKATEFRAVPAGKRLAAGRDHIAWLRDGTVLIGYRESDWDQTEGFALFDPATGRIERLFPSVTRLRPGSNGSGYVALNQAGVLQELDGAGRVLRSVPIQGDISSAVLIP